MPGERRKDAADIAYLLQQYWCEDRDNGTFWDQAWLPILTENGGDQTIVAMQLFGQRAATIATEDTRAYISQLLNDELEGKPLETLAIEMSRSTQASTDDCLHWLAMFKRGFGGA